MTENEGQIEYYARLKAAHTGAIRAAHQEINEEANLYERWDLDPVHPIQQAMWNVLRGWEDYNHQLYVHGVGHFRIRPDDIYALVTGKVGRAIWKRPPPPAANGV